MLCCDRFDSDVNLSDQGSYKEVLPLQSQHRVRKCPASVIGYDVIIRESAKLY